MKQESAQRLIPKHLSSGVSLTIAIRENGGGGAARKGVSEGCVAELATEVAVEPCRLLRGSPSPRRRSQPRRTKDRAWNPLPSAQHSSASMQPPLHRHSSKDLIYAFLNKGNLTSGTGLRIRP